MKYGDVEAYIRIHFPECEINELEEGLEYLVASAFTRYLLDNYLNNRNMEVNRCLIFIEELHLSEDEKVRELANIGYLESIQNTWPSEIITSSQFYLLLGKKSRIYWKALNDFWEGKVNYISE